jgi:phosphatidylinositol alpha 1,6-mannosyltransferase
LTIRKIEQEILAAGHHVCILTTKSGDPKLTHMDGEHPNRSVLFLDNSIPIPFLHDPNNPETSYHMGFALSRTVKEKIADFEPSLIHITVPDCTCLHLIQYARKKEIPLMGTYHSNIPEYMEHYQGIGWLKHILHAFFRHQYNFLQALYVPTPFIHKFLADTQKIDKVTNLGIWGRGIDLERFSPKHRSRKFRHEMGFDDNDVVICWVGRLVPEKRPDIFCQVVRRLAERNIPFRALVVGAGPLEEEVKSLPNTTFAGWMSGDELSVAYASSDIFLFPSAVETFGNVTLEAAASGLPLVVEAGCSGHLVNHGVNGFACHEHDLDAFFDSTLCLVLDDVRRKSMSQEGRQFSLQFEKRSVCKKMLENYSKVTDEFYFEYGGHHANRDQIYTKENSFLGGNHPRPMVLIFVEYLFLLIFRVMYQMAIMFLYIRESVLFTPHSSSVANGGSQRHINSPMISARKSPTVAVVNGAESTLGSIQEVEECSDSDTEAQDGEMKDVVLGPLKADDETDSTVSLSDDSSTGRKEESGCRLPQTDFKISHALALGFVRILQIQFLTESRLRNGMVHCCAPSNWGVMKRKRKNSSCALEVPDLQRDRSEGSDSLSDDLEQHLMNSARVCDERLSMRRSNSVILDV